MTPKAQKTIKEMHQLAIKSLPPEYFELWEKITHHYAERGVVIVEKAMIMDKAKTCATEALPICPCGKGEKDVLEVCHICNKEKGQPPERCSGHYDPISVFCPCGKLINEGEVTCPSCAPAYRAGKRDGMIEAAEMTYQRCDCSCCCHNADAIRKEADKCK